MRQPLRNRKITVSGQNSVEYPASFMSGGCHESLPLRILQTTAAKGQCVCPAELFQKYLNRVSGPGGAAWTGSTIHDEITPVPFEKISDSTPGERSSEICKRVVKARQIQAERFRKIPGIYCNAQMTSKMVRRYAAPEAAGLQLLGTAMERLSLSARAYERILKVSRTIADLDDSPHVLPVHLAEAINYRNLDRSNWAG